MSTREEMKIENLEYKIKKLEAAMDEIFGIAIEAPDIDMEYFSVTDIMELNNSILKIKEVTERDWNE